MNDLKFTIRRILKNKSTTLINLSGLTIGIFVSIILINFFIQESTYDHHHTRADDIYKVAGKIAFSKDQQGTFGITFGTLADSYMEIFPQVENTARTYGPFTLEVDVDNQRFNNNSIVYLDYSFFDLFDFPGVSSTAFNTPGSAVVSREFAEKMNGNPVGREIKIEGKTFAISAVTDIPNNTSFQFDIALPVKSDDYYESLINGGLEFETYLLLNPVSNNASTIAALNEHYERFTKEKWPEYESESFLIPLKEVYLNDLGVLNRFGNGNKQMLFIILTISILVLALALINYINLQIANNYSRLPELRLKKIMGAGKNIIIQQGIIESQLMIGASVFLAIILLNGFYSSGLSQLLGEDVLTIQQWGLNSWLTLVISFLVAGTISGLIPSLRMAAPKVITQQGIKVKKLGILTVILVIFQFFVSTSLLSVILFVNFQIDMLRNQPTGYNSEQVVLVNNLNDSHKKKYQTIKAMLEEEASIMTVAGAQGAPGNGASGQFIHRQSKSPDEGISIAHIRTINGYAKALNLEFVKGGDFTVRTLSGETQFILNESAAEKLFATEENPVGEVVEMSGRSGKIVGIVRDFHFRSFHHEIDPLAINIEEPYNLTMMIKIAPGDFKGSLQKIENALNSADPMYVFDYQFLDDQFNQAYQSELKIKSIISYATVIAFSISVLGLLALSIFVINSKIKEIAIRKVLGGSNIHIFNKLSFQLVSWVIIGNILSIPISYLITQNWVQNFIYQASLSHLLWMVPLSTVLTLIVALSTITRKLYKTMTLNPVVFLKYE
ncbi:MAG: ABC transporter permease [Cyclobacteriaceae bacterium]